MHACPRCWEVIEQPAVFAEAAVLSEGSFVQDNVGRAAPAVAVEQSYEPYQSFDQRPVPDHTVTQQAPVVAYQPAAPVRVRDRRKMRLGRAIGIGLAAGLLVAIGLIALEAVGPRLRGNQPDQVRLTREAFPEMDFAISAPRSWDVRPQTVGGLPAVTFLEPAREGGKRSVRVAVDRTSLDRARQTADTRGSTSARRYEEINIVGGIRLDGRETFRHIYLEGDEYRETWWVTRDSGTYRIEFRSPLSRREESAQLNVRLARTFDIL